MTTPPSGPGPRPAAAQCLGLAAPAVVLGLLMALADVGRGTSSSRIDAPRRWPSISTRLTCRATRCAPRARMFAALFASLLFTFTYATLAAKSRRAGLVLIPILDILQSVPILGFLSFTVVFFLRLFPGQRAGGGAGRDLRDLHQPGLEHGLQLLPVAHAPCRPICEEAARSFRLSPWQRFWRLEVPFAMPGLVWNTMMSMSGGWFFVVASEAITVGNTSFTLPGIGSYVAVAHRTARPAAPCSRPSWPCWW